MTYPFLKGHGTENDFVLLPDHDGSIHGDLSAERVRALCDRRAGIGADGVLRVVRSENPDPAVEWFMDYRNSDGSISEMCGNGVRAFARHLLDEGLVDTTAPIHVDTRAGVKVVTQTEDGLLTVDMGEPKVFGQSEISVGAETWTALHVDMGNPHAVLFVDDLADAGDLLTPPVHDERVYPHGVNVEFVVEKGKRHVGMRVHERGSGETRSCGTGACAVAITAMLADDAPRGTTYRVDLPGGRLDITWTADNHILMTGPAVVVAKGETDL
ncbi:diaminopimelate epimerase [Nocardioides yefusunii]|uniref:Diaminopimelate epimerase n=1 Tax=Nocardioides yefusunii TaxID=2500546 RepID=A0ABW1QXC4_9ACTN|nr:diaminopimelate epimerase [Nocardioides yefusunii]